ncbi:hypothetical protein Tco_0840910 [Tanacetum coccineum]|uniref:Integrase, catalytic region, zinc finger, CCHC-type, peptidase aspartic, catalytic n=1 Tax=Tanacetum coccineum TaxID=301880 RepID=A0ABQ5AYG1_9ASTR
MSNVSPQQYSLQSSTTPPSTHVSPVTYLPHFADNTQLDSGLSPTDNLIENLTITLALLTQSYKTYLPQTNNQLKTSSNTRNQATVQDGRVVVQNVQGRQYRGQGNNLRGAGAAINGGAQNRVGNANPGQARQIKCYNCNAQENGVVLDEEMLLFLAGGHDIAVDEDVDELPIQDLALNVDNVFQADECDAFDSDVDKAPTAQTMFMENLSSTDPVYDVASPSYDSDILSEVHEYDNYQDAVCEDHDVHEMHHDVQPNCVVDSNADYTSDSNMITYDLYVKDNAKPVVQSNVSSVTNDAYMMIINEMHEQTAQSISVNKQNKVVNASLTAELATYKEQVELYERRAKFELTEREQKIEEQLRIVITDHNIKEENLKKELHSVKMQLNSTINHNKSMVEEVTSLKKDFKQKENRYLEEFLDMKALKEKVEDNLYKQDQSLQTVHMLCKLKPYYDEQKKVAIGYKNPLCLTRAKQVQPVLYNGHEIIKSNHVPAIVHNSEDTLEIAEITRKKMNDKMKTPLVLPAKSQVKINIFALIQLFLEFEKTFKKGITPTGLTEWERGFEQTKECYLTEVIPFFKILKEHFEGIQKALTKEIKEIKEFFKELEAEVDQNVVNRKYDEIERKNLLIANDNLIADCLSKEVFYIATNSELTVSRFTEMHDAHIVVQARCLELKAELLKLHDKITRAKHIKQTTALLTENENLKAQIHENPKCITMDSVKPRVLAPGSVETLREIVKEYKVEIPLDRSLAFGCLYTKHSQELLEYVIGTCPKDFNKRDKKHASTPLTRKKQVTFKDQCETSNNNTHKHVEQLNIQKTNVPVIPSTGVNSCTDASGSQPRSNTKKNRISPAKSVNKEKTCNKCLIYANHDMCVVNYLHSVNASPSVKNVVRKVKQVWKPKQVKQVWKATGKVLTNVGYQWRPTGRIFTLREQCPLTRLTKSKVVPAKQTDNISTSKTVITKKLHHTSQKQLTRYQRKNQQYQAVLVSLPTSLENQAIAASMQSAIAYANQ